MSTPKATMTGGFGLTMAKLGETLFFSMGFFLVFAFFIFLISFAVFNNKEKNIKPNEMETTKSKTIRIGNGVCNSMVYVCLYLCIVSFVIGGAFSEIRVSQYRINHSSGFFILIFWMVFLSIFIGFFVLLGQRFKDMVKNVKNPPRGMLAQEESNKKFWNQISGLIVLGIAIPITGFILPKAYPFEIYSTKVQQSKKQQQLKLIIV